jgi:UDP-GlcNAc3NAcA epimerase
VEAVLLEEKPDGVVVYGDTNSTLAGALAAAKLHLPVVHIEAGLRSFNRRLPEEINRVLTDHLSSLLCCPTEAAVANLRAEGFTHIINEGRRLDSPAAPVGSGPCAPSSPVVVNTGDVMFDAFLLCQGIASRRSKILENLAILPRGYFLATVHRAGNTDDSETLGNIVRAFVEVSQRCPVIFPLHPRTRQCLEKAGLDQQLAQAAGLKVIAPVGYLDMLVLESEAALILTDSGGVQREAFFAGVPCLTLRDETEWVETLAEDFNILAGTDPEAIVALALQPRKPQRRSQPYGSGDAAHRVVACLRAFLGRASERGTGNP